MAKILIVWRIILGYSPMHGRTLNTKANFFSWIVALGLLFSFSTAHAAPESWGASPQSEWTQQKEPLPEEQAFQVEAIQTEQGALIRMTPAPGYYIYQARTQFLGADNKPLKGTWPTGETHDDPHFGSTIIHRVQIEVPLSITKPLDTLRVDFQGCQDKGICYPPMSRTIALNDTATTPQISNPPVLPADPIPPKAQDEQWVEKLATKPTWWLLSAFFLGGLALSFTPCVLPMVPVVLGLVAPEAQGKRATHLALAYVLAHALVLALVGALGALMGGGAGLIQLAQRPSILIGSALFFGALGAWQAGWVHAPSRWSLGGHVHRISAKLPHGRLWGAIGLGAASALILGPCVAPLTAGALIFVAQSGSPILGASVLFMMGLGMGVPLLAMAFGAGHLVPKTGGWMVHLSRIAAMGLFAVAALLLDRATGQHASLWWGWVWLTGSIALWISRKNVQWILAVMVAVLITIAIMKSHNASQNQDTRTGLQFETVSAKELQRRLSQGTPVLLDLDAAWCSACITMQKSTFSDPSVAKSAEPFISLRLNLNEIDQDEQAFLKQYRLIGPPAILFFDTKGQEVRAARLIGEEKPAEFADRLDRVAGGER